MKKPMGISRRRAIQLLAGTSAASLLPFEWLPGRFPLLAGAPRRRHLINLIGYGGWDSTWLQNAFSEADLASVSGVGISQSRAGFEYPLFNSSSIHYTQKCSSQAESEMVTHPNGFSKLGPLARVIFENPDSELQDMLIWKGMVHSGEHGFGNNLILQGNSSSYAISFSGLISKALSEVNRRPLHYTMLAGAPADLFTNTAMASGDMVPVCVPSREQFEALTTVNRYELSQQRLRDILQDTVVQLSESGLRAKARTTADQVSAGAFRASFEGVGQIYGTQMLEDPEFKWLLKYYQMEMFGAFRRAYNDPNLSDRGSLQIYVYQSTYKDMFRRYDRILSALAPLPPLATYLANPAAYAANVAQVNEVAFGLVPAIYYDSAYDPLIKQQSFNYALADFLVRRNYSAVVDLPAWPGLMDAHSAYLNELMSLIATFSSYRALIKSLKAVPAGDGGSVFDSTLIAMHTEFDREAWHTERGFTNAEKHAGTNHGPSASVLLAGYGIRRGRVVGDIHRGPAVHSAFAGRSYGQGLPIDYSTGLANPAGRLVNTLAIMPTIMEIFGVRIPFQQVTDWTSVAAVIDPNRA